MAEINYSKTLKIQKKTSEWLNKFLNISSDNFVGGKNYATVAAFLVCENTRPFCANVFNPLGERLLVPQNSWTHYKHYLFNVIAC